MKNHLPSSFQHGNGQNRALSSPGPGMEAKSMPGFSTISNRPVSTTSTPPLTVKQANRAPAPDLFQLPIGPQACLMVSCKVRIVS
jgi:hypothetical protein